MNSLEIREEKLKLIDMTNKIALPLEVKRMMLKEVLDELNTATEREINSLLEERNKEAEMQHEEGNANE